MKTSGSMTLRIEGAWRAWAETCAAEVFTPAATPLARKSG